MINRKVQLFAFVIMTLSMGGHAAPQAPRAAQQPANAPAKAEASTQNGGTYKDEVEIMKFDQYTGRDSFAIPFDEDALEVRPESKPAKTK